MDTVFGARIAPITMILWRMSALAKHSLLIVMSLLVGCAASTTPLILNVREIVSITAPEGDAGPLELSGLARVNDAWFVVSDQAPVPSILRLESTSPTTMVAKSWWTLPIGTAWGRSDLEGITPMVSGFLLVNEATSSVVRIDEAGVASVRRVERSELLPPTNAGLEGVAAGYDRKGKFRVFVAKEREPRFLLELDPGSLAPVGSPFDVPSPGLPRLDRFEDGRPCNVPSDFADLCIADGYLYALVRNGWEVVKIDMITRVAVARVKFPKFDHEHYHATQPFGLVEGLWVADDSVWLLVDSNDCARREPTMEHEALMARCVRPYGF